MTLLAALAGAVVVSFSAIFFALSETSPLTGSFFRAAYAIPVLAVIWSIHRRRDTRPLASRFLALAAGFALGIDIILWHTAIDHIGAGLATLIANAQVIFVGVGAWAIHGERPPVRMLATVPVVLVGVALVTGLGRSDSFGSNPLLGAGLALMASVFYAAFLLGFRASNKEQAPPSGPLLEATVGALAATTIGGAITGGLELAPSWPAHGWLLALALGAQVAGWLSIGYALPRLPAVETSTIILLQPVLTMTWGALIFVERPSPTQMIGAVIVLLGVGYVALTRARSAATAG